MKILYICTHNRCRSIMAEAITNQIGGGAVTAISAGSQPAGQVHPLTLKYLEAAGISTGGLQSKSWDYFEDDKPDVVITVCDSAAGEVCPLWLGDCEKVHWSLPDPSRVEGCERDIEQAFMTVINCLKRRIMRLRTLEARHVSLADELETLKELGQEEVVF